MPEIVQVESKVISLGEESNDMYMSLEMIYLTSEVNLNKLEFSEDFIYGIELEKDKYIGLPLVCDITKLEKGEYDKLTHKHNKKKNIFGTQSIGSFVDFKTNKNGNILELIASARIWKRNPKTCAALEELYNSDEGLKFSYEVLVGKFTKENGITKIPKDDSNNPIGSCVVSTPAVPASKATLLVAEAYEADFINNENLEEGEILPGERSKDTFTMDEMFKNTKVHLSTELAELDLNQIRKKIYNALKGKFADDYWNYDIIDQFPNYVIVQYWNTGDYYKLTYTVSDSDVTLADPVKVTKNYVEIQEVDNVTVAELEGKVKELETQIASKDTIIAEKETTIQSKDTEIAELNTKVTTLSESVITKDTELAELKTVKASYDTIMAEKAEAELAEKKTILKEKYSKLLDETVLAEVEIAEAIDNLNEDVLKNKVVELAMSKATENKPEDKKETLTASRITDSVSIGKNDLISKYITIKE